MISLEKNLSGNKYSVLENNRVVVITGTYEYAVEVYTRLKNNEPLITGFRPTSIMRQDPTS